MNEAWTARALWTPISALASTFLTDFSGPWPRAIVVSIGRATRQPSSATDWTKQSFFHCAAAAKRCFIKKREAKRPRVRLELPRLDEALIFPLDEHPPQTCSSAGTSLPVQALPGIPVHSLRFELCNLGRFATSNKS